MRYSNALLLLARVFCYAYTIILTCSIGYATNLRFTNRYLIKIKDEDISTVKEDLSSIGLSLRTKIVRSIYLFVRENQLDVSHNVDNEFIERLTSCCHGKVIAAEQEVESKKMLWPTHGIPVASEGGEDYHSANVERHVRSPMTNQPYIDMGVYQVWAGGITGKGVRIAVTDVGINATHPDLAENVDKDYCYNVLTNKTGDVITPAYHPNYHETEGTSDHGTNCAGLISGLRNDLCGDGVAYGSTLVGIKIFEVRKYTMFSRFSDANAGLGLSYGLDYIDVYSNSWSSAEHFDSYHLSMASRHALNEGIKMGRGGKGSIYVFPVGALADGYSNSPHTITVNEIISQGTPRNGSILCACTITSTYGQIYSRQTTEHHHKTILKSILTTASSYSPNGCTSYFHGTSAATAIVAGIIGLALESNKRLTWRDIQHLLVESSGRDKLNVKNEFLTNGAGKFYHYRLGFGFLSASKMIELAKTWSLVTEQTCRTYEMIIQGCSTVYQQLQCSARIDIKSNANIERIEHVAVELSYTTPNEKKTEISLRSPNDTMSILMDMGQSGAGSTERRNVQFLSVHFWGERVRGTWEVILRYKSIGSPSVYKADLTLCGNTYVDEHVLPGTTVHSPDHHTDHKTQIKKQTSDLDANIEHADGMRAKIQQEHNENASYKCVIAIIKTIVLVGCGWLYGTFGWSPSRNFLICTTFQNQAVQLTTDVILKLMVIIVGVSVMVFGQLPNSCFDPDTSIQMRVTALIVISICIFIAELVVKLLVIGCVQMIRSPLALGHVGEA